jgi:predicted MFS family arabinose efflux permease
MPNRERCTVLAMLLLVTMVLVCWCCPRHADRECCAVLAMLLLVTWCWSAGAALAMLIMSAAPFGRCYCWW